MGDSTVVVDELVDAVEAACTDDVTASESGEPLEHAAANKQTTTPRSARLIVPPIITARDAPDSPTVTNRRYNLGAAASPWHR